MSRNPGRALGWWILILIGAGAALLIAWLARLVSVPLTTLLTAGAVVIALSWLIVLVTVPWNLHFAARRAAAEMAVSRERGISVRTADDAEAARISGRMLRFALGAHLATAVAAAAIAYISGSGRAITSPASSCSRRPSGPLAPISPMCASGSPC